MKLYNLFEEVIFEQINAKRKLLSEGVEENDIINDIKNKRGVNIEYRDTGQSTNSKRYIRPYVYGKMFNGNYAIVAFQIAGGSKTNGKGSWKIFRVDRIANWSPTNMKINLTHDEYNPNGSQKGNFIPGEVVDTFSNIIYQFKPEGTNVEPTKQPVVKPVTKPTQPFKQQVAKVEPTKQPEVKPTQSVKQPVAKPSVKPVTQQTQQPQLKQSVQKNEPNNIEKEEI